MGGRGGSSGFGKESGFQFTNSSGRTVRVQRNAKGVVLVNGTPNTQVNYESLRRGAKSKPGFKSLSDTDIKKMRASRAEERAKKPDYELGGGVPWGNKDQRRAARMSRLTGRAMSKKR